MVEERIPLIYVASNGRSGSTLLDLLLGAHPDVWTLGEAQMLDMELHTPAGPCGCGVPVVDCPYWKSVLSEVAIDAKDYPVHFFRIGHPSGKVLRFEYVADLLRGKTRAFDESSVAQYGTNNAKYFDAARRVAEKRNGTKFLWLVDASKDPYRLLWLKSSGLFDIRVVHLVKDPRAYVYSMTLSHVCHTTQIPIRALLYRSLRFAGRWIVENLIISRLCRAGFPSQHVFRLRYEDLAATPEDVLKSLCAWLGLDHSTELVERFRDYENHALSGNKMRWEIRKVEFDERWRSALPSVLARLVWAMTWPLARAWGYR